MVDSTRSVQEIGESVSLALCKELASQFPEGDDTCLPWARFRLVAPSFVGGRKVATGLDDSSTCHLRQIAFRATHLARLATTSGQFTTVASLQDFAVVQPRSAVCRRRSLRLAQRLS